MLAALNRQFLQPLMAWKAASPHLKHLRILERTQYDPLETIRDRQLRAVQEIARHAWSSVPYYRERWQTAGLHPRDLHSLEDLRHFPILTKADIRTNGDRLRSDLYRGEKLFAKTTSGSTGVPLTVFVDAEAMAWKRACTIRSDQWSGWTLGERVARLWGHGAAERGGWKAQLMRRLAYRESYLKHARH